MRSLNQHLGDDDANRGDHEVRAEEKSAECADCHERQKEEDGREQRTVTFPLRRIAFAEARVKSHRALVSEAGPERHDSLRMRACVMKRPTIAPTVDTRMKKALNESKITLPRTSAAMTP